MADLTPESLHSTKPTEDDVISLKPSKSVSPPSYTDGFHEIEARLRKANPRLLQVRRPLPTDLSRLVTLFNLDRVNHPESYYVVPRRWTGKSLQTYLDSLPLQQVLIPNGTRVDAWAGGSLSHDGTVHKARQQVYLDQPDRELAFRMILSMSVANIQWLVANGVKQAAFKAPATSKIWNIGFYKYLREPLGLDFKGDPTGYSVTVTLGPDTKVVGVIESDKPITESHDEWDDGTPDWAPQK